MSSRKEIDMEHRWGRRTSLWTAVTLRTDLGNANGRVRNASASGAFIETPCRVTPGSRVDIEFRGAWLSAHVVRTDDDGLGLEWHEFAPAPIVETLDRLAELRQLHADDGRVMSCGGWARRIAPHDAAAHTPRTRQNDGDWK
jgi:hypothetical protein